MKTAQETKSQKLAELENELLVVEFVRDNVLTLLRKHDGKKITKHISNDVQKTLADIEDAKVFDLYPKRAFLTNTVESGNIAIDYKNNRYDVELYATRVKVGVAWGYDGIFVYENTEKNVLNKITSLKKSIESYKGAEVTDTKEIANKLDTLWSEYQALIDSLSYEEKVLVSRDLKHSPSNLTNLKHYS